MKLSSTVLMLMLVTIGCGGHPNLESNQIVFDQEAKMLLEKYSGPLIVETESGKRIEIKSIEIAPSLTDGDKEYQQQRDVLFSNVKKAIQTRARLFHHDSSSLVAVSSSDLVLDVMVGGPTLEISVTEFATNKTINTVDELLLTYICFQRAFSRILQRSLGSIESDRIIYSDTEYSQFRFYNIGTRILSDVEDVMRIYF